MLNNKPSPDPQDLDDVLDYATLSDLRGDEDGDGPLDHPCPLCGPNCRAEYNQTRPTLRTWKPGPGFITYYCARCEAKGYAHANGKELTRPRIAMPPPVKPRAPSADLHYVERLWLQASHDLPAKVIAYFEWRGIRLERVPKGVLKFHPQCPWGREQHGCIVARFSDAVTGELRGLWRRFYAEKPKTLGQMGGCVIRLFPEIGKRLVIAEGVENALTAATVLSYRDVPLHPAWATGCANNMRRLPVIEGVEQLIILVDNDSSGTGQKAAEECARRWAEAGREVIRLMPKEPDTDFNDLVRK
jgi:putative DNA primase/helicase